MSRFLRHKGLIFAVFGGVIFALTSPPTDLYPAVFVGLTLLALSIEDAPTTLRAFGRGAAWATAAGVVGLRFVPAVIQRFTTLGTGAAYLALVLLAAGQSLLWAIGAGVTSAIHKRTRAPFELAFAAGVFVVVALPSIFAWTPAGLVSPWPSLVQLADVIGERGVSVLFAVSAALLARGIKAAATSQRNEPRFRQKVWAPIAAALAIPVLLAGYGKLRIRTLFQERKQLPTLSVALINHAIGPEDRWDAKNHPSILRKLREMTRDAEAAGAELTVWPEAAYPYALELGSTQAPRGTRALIGDGVRGPILFGLITYEKPTRSPDGTFERFSRNSATLISPDGTLQPSYDKLELLWFGETVPLGGYLPWLRRLFQKSGGLVPGTEPHALVLARANGDVRMGVLNCYEDTLAGVGKRITRELHPNLLVNVTNDAWFFGTAEPELHARLAAMRAIEHRLDLVRGVNLGVLSWIDASGVVISRDASQIASTLIANPTIRDGSQTFYGKFGDKPLVGLLVVAIVWCAWRARRDGPAKADASSERTKGEAGVNESAYAGDNQAAAPEGDAGNEVASRPPDL